MHDDLINKLYWTGIRQKVEFTFTVPHLRLSAAFFNLIVRGWKRGKAGQWGGKISLKVNGFLTWMIIMVLMVAWLLSLENRGWGEKEKDFWSSGDLAVIAPCAALLIITDLLRQNYLFKIHNKLLRSPAECLSGWYLCVKIKCTRHFPGSWEEHQLHISHTLSSIRHVQAEM